MLRRTDATHSATRASDLERRDHRLLETDAIAIVMIAAAATEGADVDPVASRAVTSAAAGPYFVAAMGLAVMLAAAGLLTLRSRVFARWIGIVALLGALAFVITFFALIQGTSEDSVFGYGFLPGILALAIWSIATSIATYRTLSTTAPESGATAADS